MHTKKWMVLIFYTAISLLSVSNAMPQEEKENMACHAFYGKMNVSTTDPLGFQQQFP